MDQKIINKLEREIEDAIRGIIARHLKPPRLPLLRSGQTIHLMAKAAVAVYEAVAENYERETQEKPST